MLLYLARRLLVAVLVCLTVLVFAFALTRLSGDLAISIAGANATAADIEIVRKAYGLDRPIVLQFLDWVGRAAMGDFGQSYFYKEKVATLIFQRVPITMTLGVTGLGIALAVALPLGIVSALREGTHIDRAVGLVALIGQALPSFWFGLILMIVFGLHLGWLPISGTGSWEHFVMPGIVLAFSAVPALLRLTRAGMIDAMAKGAMAVVPPGRSNAMEGLPSAALPIVAFVPHGSPAGQAAASVTGNGQKPRSPACAGSAV